MIHNDFAAGFRAKKNEIKRLNKRIAELEKENKCPDDMAINLIIDDSDHQNGIFVEVENDKGQSIRIGEESRTEEGYRKIRINTLSIINNERI